MISLLLVPFSQVSSFGSLWLYSSFLIFLWLNSKEVDNMTKDRNIGVALDFSKGCKLALKWAIDNLLEKGDTLYVIHVKAPLGDESRNLLWSTSGSRKVLYFSYSKFVKFNFWMMILMFLIWDCLWVLDMQLWFHWWSFVKRRW